MRIRMVAMFGAFSFACGPQDGVCQPGADQSLDRRVVVGAEDILGGNRCLSEGVLDDLPASDVSLSIIGRWAMSSLLDRTRPAPGRPSRCQAFCRPPDYAEVTAAAIAGLGWITAPWWGRLS